MLDDEVTRQEAERHLRAQLDAALPSEVLRQESLGESSAHYAHFLAYLAMGVHRGLHPLAKQRQVDARWMERLSSRFQWRRRVAIWDDALQRRELRQLALSVMAAQGGQAA